MIPTIPIAIHELIRKRKCYYFDVVTHSGDEENHDILWKCICLFSQTTPSNHCTYWKSFWIVNWASKSAGLFVGTVIWSSSGFQLGSSIKTSVHLSSDGFALENAKSYNKQFITRKVVRYGCIFTRQIYFFSPKRLQIIKLTRKNTQSYYTFLVITSIYMLLA